MQRAHLEAKQERIVQVLFKADPAVLTPYRVPGTEAIGLEDGVAIGLTASLFRDVTYKGIRISGENLIPKLDLQFYVCWRSGDGQERSGAVLLDEFFPEKRNILVSKWLIGNAPSLMPMDQDYRFGQEGLISQFRWEHEGKWSTLKVAAVKDMDSLDAEGDPRLLAPSHYFFRKKKKLFRCRVEHPEWKVHPVFEKEVRIDPSAFSLGSEDWNPNTAHSVHSIEGSSVSFTKPQKVRS